MTGFGRGQSTKEGISVDIEVKTLNSRYREFNIKLPSELSYMEHSIINRLKESVERGKVNAVVNVDIDLVNTSDQPYNEKLLERTYLALQKSAQKLGASSDISIGQLLHIPDLFESKIESENVKKIKEELLLEALDQAAERLVNMRVDEGRELGRAMLGAIKKMEELLAEIEKMAPLRVEEARKRIHERISELLGNEQFDQERLELEVAILADKLDIEEEFVRLHSHFKFFREAVQSTQAGGRKLNFLTQEMNREINTIGSKSNNAQIQHLVVNMKEILEQVREQVQNVE